MARDRNTSYSQTEFSNFTDLLDKLLAVPHAKIKTELEAEKQRPKRAWRTGRAKPGHAFRDEGGAD